MAKEGFRVNDKLGEKPSVMTEKKLESYAQRLVKHSYPDGSGLFQDERCLQPERSTGSLKGR